MVGLISCMCGAENWLLIDLVLFVKKVAKSSAVKEVVGGGGGGQRRELNVLKRLLCQIHCVRNETGIQQQVKNKNVFIQRKPKTQSQKSTSWHSPMARSSLPRRAKQRPASAEPAGQRGGEKAINSRR